MEKSRTRQFVEFWPNNNRTVYSEAPPGEADTTSGRGMRLLKTCTRSMHACMQDGQKGFFCLMGIVENCQASEDRGVLDHSFEC